jgi:hypothetical protein
LEPPRSRAEGAERFAQEQAEIQRDLVISAAACVQLAPDRSNHRGESALDCHMDIFVFRGKRETLIVELCANVLQPTDDRRSLTSGQNAGSLQALAMRDATQNIVLVQATVDRER